MHNLASTKIERWNGSAWEDSFSAAGGLLVWSEDGSGFFVPDGDNTRDMGTAALRIKKLHLSEDGISLDTGSNEAIFAFVSNVLNIGTNSGVRDVKLVVSTSFSWTFQASTGDMVPSGTVQTIGSGTFPVEELWVGRLRLGSSGNVNVNFGTGTPEASLIGGIGSLYVRSDGGAGTTLYVKESGAGNTGWVGK